MHIACVVSNPLEAPLKLGVFCIHTYLFEGVSSTSLRLNRRKEQGAESLAKLYVYFSLLYKTSSTFYFFQLNPGKIRAAVSNTVNYNT